MTLCPDLDVEIVEERPRAAEVIELFAAARLNGPLDDEPRVQAMIDTAQHLLVARRGGGLVGLIRVLTDFAYNAFIADLAVHPDVQRTGVGSALVERAVRDFDGVKFVVHAGHGSTPFWLRQGFEPAECVVRPRRY